jgi:hypothetical protein
MSHETIIAAQAVTASIRTPAPATSSAAQRVSSITACPSGADARLTMAPDRAPVALIERRGNNTAWWGAPGAYCDHHR